MCLAKDLCRMDIVEPRKLFDFGRSAVHSDHFNNILVLQEKR